MVDPSRRLLKTPETQKLFPLITCFYYEKELFYNQVFSKGKTTTPDGGGARSSIWRINFGNAGLESISLCFKSDRSGTIRVEIQLWETLYLVADETTPRSCKPLARVIEVLPGSEGFVRRVKVKTNTTVLERPVVRCMLLEAPSANGN